MFAIQTSISTWWAVLTWPAERELGLDDTQTKCSIKATTVFLRRYSYFCRPPSASRYRRRHDGIAAAATSHYACCLLSRGTCPSLLPAWGRTTHNYRCRTIEELADLVFEWLKHGVPFEVERNVYFKRPTVREQHFSCCGELFSCVTPGLTYDGDAGGCTRWHPGI